MTDLVTNPDTKLRLEKIVANPAHAILLIGPPGIGKASLANNLAASILKINTLDTNKYAYIKVIRPIEGKSIGIEAVRSLENFLSLKVPGKQTIKRVVLILDSHLLGIEAQNALLKILEEPPQDTVIIMTANQQTALLPTIQSRVQTTNVVRPELVDLKAYFTNKGYEARQIEQAYAISGGLPGLMSAILENNEHPLLNATKVARQLLGQTKYERLLSVDTLAKDRVLALDTTFILQQMAHIRLQSADRPAESKWSNILASAYEASEMLAKNTNSKLILTNLMLNL